MDDNEHDSDIENEIHQGNENEQNQNQNPADYFKVTPDDYTDSDSNTIIDFDEEEDLKEQNETFEKKENENHLHDKESQNVEENLSDDKEKEKKLNDEERDLDGISNKKNIQKNQENNEEDQVENGEEQEEDQENHEENEEEENGITDPNVKKLMKMDMADKEGIIGLLMKDNLVKKHDVKSQSRDFLPHFTFRDIKRKIPPPPQRTERISSYILLSAFLRHPLLRARSEF